MRIVYNRQRSYKGRQEEFFLDSVAENIALVRSRIAAAAKEAGRDPGEVALLAAIKQQPVDRIRRAIECGVDAIGENRVQEMLSKEYEKDGVPLHFIGHLQRNKVKSVVGRVALIHSVDSLRLADEISACALEFGILQDVLLEVNIAGEETKSGFSPEGLLENLYKVLACEGLRVVGLMCIPPAQNVENANRKYFSQMRKLFVDISTKIVDNNNEAYSSGDSFNVLSMGMSGDYEEAVRCGATIVRLGRVIFGERG